MPRFVHLHNHSHYSLLDGLTKIEDLVARRFNGHITLARLDRFAGELPELSRALSGSFVAQSMELMESKLKSKGSEYAPMVSWTFREAWLKIIK